jgi:hypothetical protein
VKWWTQREPCNGFVFFLVSAINLAVTPTLHSQNYAHDSEPALLSHDELVQLSRDQDLGPTLAEKLRVITTTSFINNEAYYRGARPRPLELPNLGPSLRVAFWNIERGLALDDTQLFLTDNDAFMAKVQAERKKAKESGKRLRAANLEAIPKEIETLKAADVWILNEVDWALKRTQYREVVRELAKTLDMNRTYGVEFLEIDLKTTENRYFRRAKSNANNFSNSLAWRRIECARSMVTPCFLGIRFVQRD